MKLSSPKFDGDSRWVLHNPQITENDRTFNDRYGSVCFTFLFKYLLTIFCRFYRCANNRALACNGAKITSIHYEPKDPNKNCQWFIVDKITSWLFSGLQLFFLLLDLRNELISRYFIMNEFGPLISNELFCFLTQKKCTVTAWLFSYPSLF